MKIRILKIKEIVVPFCFLLHLICSTQMIGQPTIINKQIKVQKPIQTPIQIPTETPINVIRHQPINLNFKPTIEFSAFHGQTGQQHQSQFDDPNGLGKKGYRLTSLSIYRNSGSLEPQYATVWTKDNNKNAWMSCHGVTAEQYQGFFDAQVKAGYHPTVITATGGDVVGNGKTNTALFGAVFEKGNVGFQARHNIDEATFHNMCTWAKANGYYLRWATIYGGRERLYAGIWEQSSIVWDYVLTGAIDGPFSVPMTQGNLKLNFLTKGAFSSYLMVYTNNNYDIKECHALNSAAYQNAFNGFVGAQYIPIVVQVGGDSRQYDISNTNHIGLFRKY